jgi:hypothetical protein
MANYMFILRPTEKIRKTVCPQCAERGEVISSCTTCHGAGVRKQQIPQYYVQDKPICISKIDRDPKTGILRYWDSRCEFFYETVYPELNEYVPKVPHGVHLCHDSMKSAQAECERINTYLNRMHGKSAEVGNNSLNF